MKSTLFALLLALLLPALSDAKPSKPGSFKSGFSSQKASSTSGSGRSGSALSQRLSRDAAQANALRTLDARRALQQAQQAPAPYERRAQSPRALPAPSPIVVQQASNGLGNVVAGFVLGRAAASGQRYGGGATPATPATAGSGVAATLLRTGAWLAILSLLAWVCWSVWKFLRRRHAAGSANYAFER